MAGELYQVLESKIDSERFELRIELNPCHIIYEGHFPGHALAPGVIQLAIIEEICNTQFKKSLQLKRINKCKFLGMIDPNKNPIVNITIDIGMEVDAASVSAAIWEGGITFFEMKVVLQITLNILVLDKRPDHDRIKLNSKTISTSISLINSMSTPTLLR